MALFNLVSVFIASGFCTGLIPGWFLRLFGKKKSGSGGGFMGRVAATGISIWIWYEVEPQYRALATLAAIVLTFVLGLITSAPAANWFCKHFGKSPRHTGVWTRTDYNWINIDEILGQLFVTLAVCLVPFTAMWANYVFFAIGFALFHYFDTAKPGPIAKIEKKYEQNADLPATLKSSYGVLVDDIVGGAMAGGIVLIVMLVFHIT